MNMRADKTELFERTPVPQAVAKLAIPTILSQLVVLVYHLADSIFVGRTGDPNQMAALTLAFPVYMLVTGLANLFGIGASSLISRSLGVKDAATASRTSTFSFYTALACAILMSLALALGMTPLLNLLGASPDTLGYTSGYLFYVMVLGAPPTVAALVLSAHIRSEGRTKEASFGVTLGGLLNIFLDPLFIFMLRMDVAGAGLATMLSNCVSLAYYILILCRLRGNTVLDFHPSHYRPERGMVKEVLLVGFPAACLILLGSTSNAVLTRLASGYSDIAVAAFGVTQKIGDMAKQVGIGLTQGIMPLIGYNFASGNRKRVRETLRLAFVSVLVFGVVFVVVAELLAPQLVGLFIPNAATVELGAAYLCRWILCTPSMCLVLLLNSVFQSMGLWKPSLLLTFLRQICIYIPLLFLMNRLLGQFGLMWCAPIVDTAALVLGLLFYRHTTRKQAAPL
ncbi:MAG: MATE family efflux transporter [Oscillospiraceae bacterium]|nr:MATE family efflux transporter [Oscillospiraceae bacterium]